MPAAPSPTAVCTWALTLFCVSAPGRAFGQQPATPSRDTTVLDSDSEEKPRKLTRWNEFDLGFTTFRFGFGLGFDYMTASQDAASQSQVTVGSGFKVRDSRLLFRGRFNTKRPITWNAGFMYDGATDEWFVRLTGITVAIPELWGNVFVGRNKEGFSLNKVMSGYDGWTAERMTMTDAIVPLLADGIKWLGYLPNRHLIWNLGVFTDWLSEGQSFSSYDYQFVARVGWVPLNADSTGTLLHLGGNFRTGQPNNGQLQLRSRPEANNLAPYFIDTGKFDASWASAWGVEAFYRPGPWLFGTEYYIEKATSPSTGDPTFHGGDIFAAWLITGETRSYNSAGGFFRAVSPARTVFERGPGAWEAVLRLSYIDLNGGTLTGGTFWRITPQVSWYLSDNARLEFLYGYGKLDRFDTIGATHFFQSRLQLQL